MRRFNTNRSGNGSANGATSGNWSSLKSHLNFFRIHLLIFVFVPLIFSGIFYGSNGTTHINYIDCLFLCFSAMTVTGLSTINVSTTTYFQQAILFFLQSIGSLVVVSITMVLTRRHYFQKRFSHLLKHSPKARKKLDDLRRLEEEEKRRESDEKASEENHREEVDRSLSGGKVIRTDMIRRTEQPPTLINKRIVEDDKEKNPATSLSPLRTSIEPSQHQTGILNPTEMQDSSKPEPSTINNNNSNSAVTPTVSNFPRTQTIGFATQSELRGRNRIATGLERSQTMNSVSSSKFRGSGIPLSRTRTSAKERGLGGFPSPWDVGRSIFEKTFTSATTAMNRTSTITSTRSGTALETNQTLESATAAPYFSFDVTVSKNSRFHDLTESQREELGGVEYRSLNVLAVILPLYWILMIGICVLISAPYLASSAGRKARSVLESQGETSPDPTWYSWFQMTSAMTNCGLSLVDTSMINLADQYTILIPMAFLILVGNTAFPVMLRFIIWSISRLVPQESKLFETLRFLLDHPRRCFVYLFPSAQTKLLILVLILFNSIDWVLFEILDLSNPSITSIPVGQRIFDGLFQGIAVRTAGFQVVGFLGIAPSVQLAYVVMQYLSAFPISLSVRSTNVYEERALGVYTEDDGESIDEGKVTRNNVGSYLAVHARRQLSYDIFWLALAVFFISIIEKNQIEDPATDTFFTIFSVLFEVVSAYGTVGLSLGTPTDNFSLSGRFRTLSKLVVVAVMIRGRHRGLPNAIDRAILLPEDLDDLEVEDGEWSDVERQDEEGSRPQNFVAEPRNIGDTQVEDQSKSGKKD